MKRRLTVIFSAIAVVGIVALITSRLRSGLAVDQIICPVDGRPGIAAGNVYGAPRSGHKHAGIDVPAAYGAAVYAAQDGNVSHYYDRSYGNYIDLVNGNHRFRYAHLKSFVANGGVRAGQLIAYADHTGNADSSFNHVHFEVRVSNPQTFGMNGTTDPMPFYNSCVQHGTTPPPPGAGNTGGTSGNSCTGVNASVVGDRLGQGQRLLRGQALRSHSGQFYLVLQGSDGHAVLYNNCGTALWATRYSGDSCFIMQSDGNLVAYVDASCPSGVNVSWASNTNGSGGVVVVMQDDGNLVIYTGSGCAVWASGTGGNHRSTVTSDSGQGKLNNNCGGSSGGGTQPPPPPPPSSGVNEHGATSPGYTCGSPHPVIPNQVRSGDCVRHLQYILSTWGYGLPQYGIDGYWGGETQNAVRRLQFDHHVPNSSCGSSYTSCDGIVGSATWSYLHQ